ncbi:MAG: CHRD domain-containing protein [Ilumatobacteraceae bacterium]
MSKAFRFGAGGLALAAGCGVMVLVPALASGGARTTVGSGKAAAAVATPFLASLSGANETPGAGDADGTGAASVTIDPVTGEICADLRVENIQTAVMAHIHRGAAGVAGPVVVPFPVLPNPTAAQCVIAAPALAAEIAGNPSGFYVNVHTADFPAGAVRGQLAPTASSSGTTQLLNEPLRAYDSRTSTDGKFTAGTTRVINLASGLDAAGKSHIAVPPGSTGALLRVTITDTDGPGFLSVYSNALTTVPATSSVNWYAAGAIGGSDPTVAVDASSKIKITAVISATHVVVDVIGYVF